MESIVGINFTFPTNDDDFLKLDSFGSLSEIDIAIILLSFSDCNYDQDSSTPSYNGKKLLNHTSSTELSEHIDHWKREISNYLQNGKTLIVLLTQQENLYFHTGKKEYSGTGRNQRVTNIVNSVNNYDFLPFQLSVYPSEGHTILATNSVVNSFYMENKNILRYEAYTTAKEIIPYFLSKNKDKILGGYLKILNGDVIVLPQIEIDYELFQKQNGDWNVKGLRYGAKLKEQFYELNKNIKSFAENNPPPSWANYDQYELNSALEIKREIANLNQTIEKSIKQKEELQNLLPQEQILKNLLFESGKPLELAVILALQTLGYSAENYNDGKLELDQVILSPEGIRYIGECEGKDNKAIDISKFRQLIDNLNEDYEREDVDEKAFGLLFGNAQRLVEPQNRELDFTTKCINGAKRERIGLIKTSDLYFVAKYLIENPNEDFKKKCRVEIHNQLGGIIVFPKFE
ncbi:MAG: hypothetical protein WC209_01095 [Ignavibacteriaceae bacterium]|jgi:hypothetical protein